jgi:hypothetical protein
MLVFFSLKITSSLGLFLDSFFFAVSTLMRSTPYFLTKCYEIAGRASGNDRAPTAEELIITLGWDDNARISLAIYGLYTMPIWQICLFPQ